MAISESEKARKAAEAARKEEAALLAKLKERMKPGLELKEGQDEELTWEGTGQADGIFYLGERAVRIAGADGVVLKEILVPSLQRQAMRYLRQASPEYKKRKPGNLGRAAPIVGVLIPKALQNLAKERELPVKHMFIEDHPAGLCPLNPEWRLKWRILEAEEGIWAAFFVG